MAACAVVRRTARPSRCRRFSVFTARRDTLPKATPANLRRFGETPVARKAINTIRDRLVGMRWDIQPRSSRQARELPDGPKRIRILSANLDHPNPDDSFRSLIEPVVEDVIVGGFGAIEIQNTGDPEQPLLLGRWTGPRLRSARTGMDVRTRPATCRRLGVWGQTPTFRSMTMN